MKKGNHPLTHTMPITPESLREPGDIYILENNHNLYCIDPDCNPD
ncbi:MAG: hypothetical protein ACE5DZ_04250 [Mariprofundus sp.]